MKKTGSRTEPWVNLRRANILWLIFIKAWTHARCLNSCFFFFFFFYCVNSLRTGCMQKSATGAESGGRIHFQNLFTSVRWNCLSVSRLSGSKTKHLTLCHWPWPATSTKATYEQHCKQHVRGSSALQFSFLQEDLTVILFSPILGLFSWIRLFRSLTKWYVVAVVGGVVIIAAVVVMPVMVVVVVIAVSFYVIILFLS